jgi:hypothetical protein
MRRRWVPLLAMALVALAGSVAAQEVEELPLAPDSILKAGNTIVLSLPATGGYQINHQTVALPDLGQEFRNIYDPRPIKVLIVVWAVGRPLSDVATVVLLAQEQGVTVYRVSPQSVGL